jgi:2'-5' RNA ligase
VIAELEVWNTPDGGRTLVVLVEPSDALKVLQVAAAGVLTGQGMPVSDFGQPENYKPHVTLAKGPALPDEVTGMISVTGGGEEVQLWIDNVCLVAPESVITAVPLLDRGAEVLLDEGQQQSHKERP